MNKNRINLTLVFVFFFVLNITTFNGFNFFWNENLIFFIAFLGIFAMPIISCYYLFKDAVVNDRKHFFSGFLILTTMYLLTNAHAIFGNIDSHGTAVFNLIILLGLLVVVISSIISQIVLRSTRKTNNESQNHQNEKQ